MDRKKHEITLLEFPFEKGKISFSILHSLTRMLQRVAAGSLRLVMEGVSSKKGPQPVWLESATDFQLTSINAGSTRLNVEAPVLQEVIQNFQLPLFDRNPEELKPYTGIDLALEALQQAFEPGEKDDLLDKHLLKEMEKYSSLFQKQQGTIKISGHQLREPAQLRYENFKDIKKLEERTPPPVKAMINGILDLMQYSKDLIQIETEQGRIRAILSGDLAFSEVRDYFGKTVTIEGIAHFKPSEKVSSIEVSRIHESTGGDDWFSVQPTPITEQLDFVELREEQKYKGTKLDNVIGHWPGDEPIEELLALLKK